MTRYVLLGNSAAAVGCIEGIRRLDTGGTITVVSSGAVLHLFPPPDLLSAGGEDHPGTDGLPARGFL